MFILLFIFIFVLVSIVVYIDILYIYVYLFYIYIISYYAFLYYAWFFHDVSPRSSALQEIMAELRPGRAETLEMRVTQNLTPVPRAETQHQIGKSTN
jgi:Ca2+/Na+ antiporter